MNERKLTEALECLCENGVDRSECFTTLQALVYILMDEEIEDYLPTDIIEQYC